MRRSTLLWSFLGISVVIGLFVVKHEVQDLESRLHRLNLDIIADRDATQVLQAEWSYLNQPGRLEALGRRYLGMTTLDTSQTITMQKLLRQNSTKLKIPAVTDNPNISPGPPPVKQASDHDWLGAMLISLRKKQ